MKRIKETKNRRAQRKKLARRNKKRRKRKIETSIRLILELKD